MYRTVLHTEYSRIRHLKKYFLARNQKSAISEYSVVQCTYKFRKKRAKLDPSGKKGIFVGYSESLKAYRIYFPGFKKIDISRDVTFDEDSAYNKSKKRPVEDPKETEIPKIQDTTMNDATQEEDRELEEPKEPIDPPLEKKLHKRKPGWVREAIQGTEIYGAPEEIHRESKRNRP